VLFENVSVRECSSCMYTVVQNVQRGRCRANRAPRLLELFVYVQVRESCLLYMYTYMGREKGRKREKRRECDMTHTDVFLGQVAAEQLCAVR